MTFVIVTDTLCEGWTCERNCDTGEPVEYATLEAANVSILSDEIDLFDNREASDFCEGETRPESVDDCEAFAVPLSEYLEGRKAVWTGQGVAIIGKRKF